MARHVQTLIAGTIAVTALCAASASDVRAQDASLVLNEQMLFGDVFAGQRLNVVEANQQVSVSNTALGNQINGGAEGRDITLRNMQSSHGAIAAQTNINTGYEVSGRVTAVTQARSNEASAAANNAALELDSRQYTYGSTVSQTMLENPDARLTGGIQATSASYSNNVLAGGTNTFVSGTVEQHATGDTRAGTYVPAHYIPGTAYIAADAAANMAQLSSNGSSGQRVEVRQLSEGWTAAETASSAGNIWASTTVSSAAANRITANNAGGSQVITADQNNTGGVSSRASTHAYDYGDLRAMADGAGNQAYVGNQDIWVEIDNTQMNSGGVSVEAQLTGYNGYDAYVGANATGNSVTGFACSDCGGIMNARNNQTNTGNVSATATTNIVGQGRAAITGTTATGNSANFYVSRPGG
ncbi:holdfast anchor protein HfaD [Brevundimonas sp.]|uniref:holdfast anchor protein HfaD n=2 Tax=Brevundimonas sp. TaxID=1871086 RepID=UPI002FC6B850